MTNPRFILTGGPGAGKTSVLETLAARGYLHAPESARAIIQARRASGHSPRPPADRFALEILQMDVRAYRAIPATDGFVFFDRGVLDALCLIDQIGALPPEDLNETVARFPFNEIVFVLPPWQQIYASDAERDQTYSEAVEVHRTLTRWYEHLGHRIVEVPRASVEERADFILETADSARLRQDRRSRANARP